MHAFLDYHAPIDGDPFSAVFNLNLLCMWEKFMLSSMLIGNGGIISSDHRIIAWLVYCCTYSKNEQRDNMIIPTNLVSL